MNGAAGLPSSRFALVALADRPLQQEPQVGGLRAVIDRADGAAEGAARASHGA